MHSLAHISRYNKHNSAIVHDDPIVGLDDLPDLVTYADFYNDTTEVNLAKAMSHGLKQLTMIRAYRAYSYILLG